MTLISGIFFSVLTLFAFKIALPTLTDNIIAGALLIFLPALALFYIVEGVLRFLRVRKAGTSNVAAGIILALSFVFIAGYDFTLPLLIIAAGVISALLSRYKSIPLGLTAAVFIYVALSTPGKLSQEDKPKIFVIGWDALTPSVLDSLAGRGELPVMRRLIEGGAWGEFESREPMKSPTLWTTIGSGYRREAHGTVGFFDVSANVKVPRLWDMMMVNGWSAGVFRWLVTWPPDTVDGFMVPDLYARDDSSWPPGYGDINSIRDFYKSGKGFSPGTAARLGWKLCRAGMRGSTTLKTIGRALQAGVKLKDDKDFYLFARRWELEVAADIFLNLMHRFTPDFAAFYDNGVDILGHRMFKYHNPAGFTIEAGDIERYRDHWTNMYRYSDQITGRFLREIGDDVKIALVSDHGMERADGADEAMYWVTTDNLFRDLDLDDIVYSQSLNLYQFVYPVRDSDWSRLEEIMETAFDRLKFANGKKLFTLDRPHGGDYIIANNYLKGEGTQLYLDQKPVELERYIHKAFNLSGKHALKGALALCGENIKEGFHIQGAELPDFAPTILHWAGLPVAKDMHGRVLMEVFRNPGEVAYIPQYEFVRRARQEDMNNRVLDEGVKEKMRALGYVR